MDLERGRDSCADSGGFSGNRRTCCRFANWHVAIDDRDDRPVDSRSSQNALTRFGALSLRSRTRPVRLLSPYTGILGARDTALVLVQDDGQALTARLIA